MRRLMAFGWALFLILAFSRSAGPTGTGARSALAADDLGGGSLDQDGGLGTGTGGGGGSPVYSLGDPDDPMFQGSKSWRYASPVNSKPSGSAGYGVVRGSGLSTVRFLLSVLRYYYLRF